MGDIRTTEAVAKGCVTKDISDSIALTTVTGL